METARLVVSPAAPYSIWLARTKLEVAAAQALRFEVFNLELQEGLAASFDTGLDADPFDEVCDHLLVENVVDGSIVGTYRLQTGGMAATNRGYYSAQEFDFSPYEKIRGEMIELGRACVHKAHRNLAVLGLLWKGIADYASARGARYLCGCSSLTAQEPEIGASAYTELCRNHLVSPEFRTRPQPAYACPLTHLAEESPKIPKLLRAYLSIGAKICGPPALDREFKTIDFLTFLDLRSLPPQVRARFMGSPVE
ncbi:MAG: GNAT family N-acetyltransferase [Verrucomicrobia bacterium]|nr:MAG: GNAT family N-acetyltransferase [Verrucomicrobiota bacterium]